MVAENTLRMRVEENVSFGEKKYIKFIDPVDVNKYLKKIKLHISLLTCASITDHPLNVPWSQPRLRITDPTLKIKNGSGSEPDQVPTK